MATLDVEDLVLADLRAFTSIAPAAVYDDDEAPMEDAIPTKDGQIIPYVVLHSGSPRGSTRGKGIVGADKDPIENYFIVEVVAPSKAIAKQIGVPISQRFLGKAFPGATELTLGPLQQYKRVVEEATVPNTYHYAALFRYITNL